MNELPDESLNELLDVSSLFLLSGYLIPRLYRKAMEQRWNLQKNSEAAMEQRVGISARRAFSGTQLIDSLPFTEKTRKSEL